MKLSSVRHLTYEGLKNVWDNRLMSLASIGVLICCMSLIGAAMLVTFNIDKAMMELEKENVIMAYLNDYNSVRYSEEYIGVSSKDKESSKKDKDTADGEDIPTDVPYEDYLVHNEEEALAVCEEIERLDNIASVEYISSEEGIERLVGTLAEEQADYITQLQEDGENPLPSAAKIILSDISRFDETVAKIQQVDGVYSLSSQQDLAKRITSINNAINTASYIIIAVLMLIALVIVCNTIRVTMFNRKLEISIMKAVGATDSFIRLPFVVEGIVIGLISAAATLALLYLGYSAVLKAMAETLTNPVNFSEHIALFGGIFAAVGVVSGLIGSVFMINRYLKKEGSEFSALS